MGRCGYTVGMTETPVRKVRVDDAIWQKALVAAKANGENLSVVIRRALIAYMKENDQS